jgi:phosphatidylinositol-3-phosphatase
MRLSAPAKAFLCLFTILLLTRISCAQNVPRSSHVWVINEENRTFEDVVGNPQMPYYNQLIRQYGLAAQFYSDQHSSLPALMWFVAGAAVDSNNDLDTCTLTQDNIVRELLANGYDWRSYQEDLPGAGFQGLYGGPGNLYYRRHNPLIDFTDVCPGTGQDTNSVPLTQMAADFAQGLTVNYAWITPDILDDDHSGSLQATDQWLRANVSAILARPEFTPGGDGILFIVWDEADDSDNRCSATVTQGCGGRTPELVIGPQVKPGYQSSITYHNENVLATVCAAMGLSTCPGAAQGASPMADFFYTASDTSPNSVVIAAPANGAEVVGAVHLMANASESQPISQTQVWDNGVRLGVYGPSVDATYNLAPGTHTTTVEDLDSNYNPIHKSSVTYSVQAAAEGVQIVSPVANEAIAMPGVQVVATATESVPVSQMQAWDNGLRLGWYPGSGVNQDFSLAPGPHTLTLLDLGSNYQELHQTSVTYSVEPDGVQILSPTPNQAATTSLVQIVARGIEDQPVSQTQVWDNGVRLGYYEAADVNQYFTLAPGTNTITVEDLDNNYNLLHQSSVTINVQPVTGVQILAPASNETIGTSTVLVAAQATESVTVNQMQVWDNGVKLGWFPGSTVNQYFTLMPGSHTLTVLALDNSYNVIHQSSVSYSVQ